MTRSRDDILNEPILSVRYTNRETGLLTLPGVFEHLYADDIESFTGLQAHQTHAWHAFLVQLATMALHQQRQLSIPSAEAWRFALLGLSGGQASAWYLVNDTLLEPAFMQPPVPEDTLAAFKNRAGTPDALDILITSKNHDVKSARMSRASAEHWIFALVSLQTMAAYGGRDTYGVARMNGGSSSRPALGFTPSLRPGAHFQRDVRVCLAHRERIVGERPYPLEGGICLLWLEPWDGVRELALSQLDPLFIEVCRRARMKLEDGVLRCWTTSTKAPRIDTEGLHGLTGDAWTPIRKEPAKALTAGPDAFSYRRLSELLFSGDFMQGVAGEAYQEDGEQLFLRASVLVGGNCKTEGFVERTVSVPPKARRWLMTVGEREALGDLARRRLKRVETLHGTLKLALCMLLQPTRERPEFRDARIEPLTRSFETAVDQVFFPSLWRDLELGAADSDRAWEAEIIQLGKDALQRAVHAVPISASLRFRAIARADSAFSGGLYKHFPETMASPNRGAAPP